jgi:hypothetical protein
VYRFDHLAAFVGAGHWKSDSANPHFSPRLCWSILWMTISFPSLTKMSIKGWSHVAG